jgi:hypothetical protein
VSASWLTIGDSLDQLAARLDEYPKERNAAASRALNRAISGTRKQASTWLRAEYPGIKVAQLKARMTMKLATRGNLTAELSFSGKRFALYDNFGMVAFDKFGVAFGKLPWRIETVSGEAVSSDMLHRAFRNRSRRSGKPLVFSRHTKVRTSQEVLVAPGLARAVNERGLKRQILQLARDRFGTVLKQEVTYRLSKG